MPVINKCLYTSALPLLLTASAIVNAADSGGRFIVTGTVIAAPCSVVESEKNFTIPLGDIAVSTLVNHGHSVLKDASIQLQGCVLSADKATGKPGEGADTKYQSVKISFNGQHVAGEGVNTDAFVNGAGMNAAKNVAVALYDEYSQPLTAADMKTGVSYQLAEGTTWLNFKVGAVPMDVSQPVTPGAIETIINYTLNYQ